MNSPTVELTQIIKTYAGDRHRKVLDGLEFLIGAGERFAITGPSGSGKSTLLNILGTLDRPSSGVVRIAGTDTAGLSDEALARLRGETIGFIFQLHHLLPQCSALENVLAPALARSQVNWSETEQRARDLLHRVGLADHLTKVPGQLSGGERQRVAVVRALINRPKLLLADEPTGALDEANARNLIDLLLEISESEGVSLVLVTHDAAVASRLDRAYELRGGTLHRK
ncbi:MAG: ABC transporter ATP-binding protein [Verrucomicrobia bacterium]|nr:ABC transporter ATP-binding protein [Verrucomicrobiota bacterium]